MKKTSHELVDELEFVLTKINKLTPQLDTLSSGDKGYLAGLYDKQSDLIYRLEQITFPCGVCKGSGEGKKHYADELIDPIKLDACGGCRGTGRQL